jgi:hypothetical protein
MWMLMDSEIKLSSLLNVDAMHHRNKRSVRLMFPVITCAAITQQIAAYTVFGWRYDFNVQRSFAL